MSTTVTKLQTKMSNILNKLLTREERELMSKAEGYTSVNFDAQVLNLLRKNYGFSAEQLKELFDVMVDMSTVAQSYSISCQYVPDMEELSEAGIPLLTWEKEAGVI